MANELIADFEKRFSGGRGVTAAVSAPLDGATVTILFGPSGSGKTTILRCLAGLETPERGRVECGGETWFDAERKINRSPQSRSIGYLFQDHALFPHMNVRHNILYGMRGMEASERGRLYDGVMELLGLRELEHRAPVKLSGGERQRVALARALARRPRLLLLDEPLSALDAPSREALRRELRRLLKQAEIPAVVVTHDRAEALALGDRMAVVHDGRVVQQGPVLEVFTKPAGFAVARVVGVETVVAGEIESLVENIARVRVGTATVTALVTEPVDREVYVCIRAEDVVLEHGAPEQSSARNRLEARVTEVEREGAMVRVVLDCGFPLMALVTPHSRDSLGLARGARVTAVVKAPAVHLVAR